MTQDLSPLDVVTGRIRHRIRRITKPLEGRVGHYCVGKRCAAARVEVQHSRKSVDVRVARSTGKFTTQQRVAVVRQRSDERSFHLLTDCDLIELLDGEYVDVGK